MRLPYDEPPRSFSGFLRTIRQGLRERYPLCCVVEYALVIDAR